MTCKVKTKKIKTDVKTKMRLNDIKEKKVYYVDYEPSVGNEFGKHHMSFVLRKNRIDKSLIVVPLTGRRDRITPDKTIKIQITGLPERLKQKESYVVINKIRTVDFSRFEPMLDKNIIEVGISDSEFMKLISFITDELEGSLNLDQKKNIYAEKINRAINLEIKNWAYRYKNLSENNLDKSSIVTKIMEIIYNNNKEFLSLNKYTFTDHDRKNELDSIIKEILEEIKKLNS